MVLDPSVMAAAASSSPVRFASPWRLEEVGGDGMGADADADGDGDDCGDDLLGGMGGMGGMGILQVVGLAQRAAIGRYAGASKAKRMLGRGAEAARRRRERHSKMVATRVAACDDEAAHATLREVAAAEVSMGLGSEDDEADDDDFYF